jgi:hypothetical protein
MLLQVTSVNLLRTLSMLVFWVEYLVDFSLEYGGNMFL